MNVKAELQSAILITLAASFLSLSHTICLADIEGDFTEPPFRYRTRPLWFWNGPLITAQMHEMMDRSKQSGYCGFGILPAPNMSPEFMSPEYLEHYKEVVEKAAELGQKMCLYDEYWFPSGSPQAKLEQESPP